MNNVLAIIPARGGSRGIPRKNIQPLAGKPLVAHTIHHALNCPYIQRVIVNSEDEEIRFVAEKYGAESMDRPEEFCHDNSVQEVDRLLYWCVETLERSGYAVDVVVLLYPTAPLRDTDRMSQAVKMVMDGEYDSVLSLYEDLTYLWQLNSNGTVSPVNYDPSKRGPRQLEHWNQYAENKAVYVMRRDLLMETGCRLGGRIGCVTMEKWRSIDVDNPADLMLCELIFSSVQADKNSNFSALREIQNENTDPGCDDSQQGKFSSKIQSCIRPFP